jgi:hypothetical protein
MSDELEDASEAVCADIMVSKFKEVDEIYAHMEKNLSAANIAMVQALFKRNIELLKFIQNYQSSIVGDSENSVSSSEALVNYTGSLQELQFNLNQVEN